MPEVAEVIDNPFPHGALDLAARRRLGRSLRARGYDEAIVLPNSWKSALVPFFAGVPVRTGFTGEGRIGLLNRRHRLDERALPKIVERYAQLAEAPGAVLARPLPLPRLVSDATARRATLAELGLAGARAPVVFCPGAEYGPAKRWPEAHYAELAVALAARGHAIWLLGSAKDRPVAAEIVRRAPGCCTDLCGTTALGQAIDLIAAATYVVTNDSGLMHVAAALGRPLIALFGSSSPEFTPPLSPQAEIVWLRVECSPCFERECPLGHFRCMREMTAASVLERIERHLAALSGQIPGPDLRSGLAD
jgi:heptosyltransferase-2